MHFGDFFRMEPIEIDVASGLRAVEGCMEIGTSLLCRDFCLSVGDDFIILASSSPADCYEIDGKPPQTYLIRSGNLIKVIENDSHTAFPSLDHVTFFLLSLKTMKVVDFLHFKYDFVYLAHHLGVGLKDGMFSILSMKNQKIFLFDIDRDMGKFVENTVISRNSYSSESVFIGKIPDGPQRDDSWGRPGICGFILKLVKRIIEDFGLHQTPLPYSILSTLHLWKHQLLPDNKMLLRLSPANLILATNPRHQSIVHALDPLPSIHKNSYLVVMDWSSGEVEKVFNSAGEEVIKWMEDNWKWLRGRAAELDEFEIIKLSIDRAGGNKSRNSLVRRFTNTIPQSPQQLCDVPWLDVSNFRWDPKITSMISRLTPISCNYFVNCDSIAGASGLVDNNYGPGAVKFFSRSSPQLLSYTLRFVDEETVAEARAQVDGSTTASGIDRHKWINIMAHPTLPLILIYQYGIFRSLSIRIFYN